jgi:hypothetical protein
MNSPKYCVTRTKPWNLPQSRLASDEMQKKGRFVTLLVRLLSKGPWISKAEKFYIRGVTSERGKPQIKRIFKSRRDIARNL